MEEFASCRVACVPGAGARGEAERYTHFCMCALSLGAFLGLGGWAVGSFCVGKRGGGMGDFEDFKKKVLKQAAASRESDHRDTWPPGWG